MEITKIFSFSAAHYLPLHQGKCKAMHGHNYTLHVSVGGPTDPETGMVMDFGDLKKIVESHLESLDHMLLNNAVDNPTAENIIDWLWERIDAQICKDRVYLSRIRLYETDTSYATRYHGRD